MRNIAIPIVLSLVNCTTIQRRRFTNSGSDKLDLDNQDQFPIWESSWNVAVDDDFDEFGSDSDDITDDAANDIWPTPIVESILHQIEASMNLTEAQMIQKRRFTRGAFGLDWSSDSESASESESSWNLSSDTDSDPTFWNGDSEEIVGDYESNQSSEPESESSWSDMNWGTSDEKVDDNTDNPSSSFSDFVNLEISQMPSVDEEESSGNDESFDYKSSTASVVTDDAIAVETTQAAKETTTVTTTTTTTTSKTMPVTTTTTVTSTTLTTTTTTNTETTKAKESTKSSSAVTTTSTSKPVSTTTQRMTKKVIEQINNLGKSSNMNKSSFLMMNLYSLFLFSIML